MDKYDHTIDFYLSLTRNTKAAKRFPSKAIAEIKQEGKYDFDLQLSQIKYLNNMNESDHGKLKRLLNPTLGFKSMKTAYAIIKGFEIM